MSIIKQSIVGNSLLRQGIVSNLFPSAGWSPLELFQSGEQGAWYDPSDLTTLFQDSAGTLPVASDGDPVGLMLDKSQGLELGAEEVVNGGFNTNFANWTEYRKPTKSITNGIARIEYGTQTFAGIYQIIPFVEGKTYELRISGKSNGFGRVLVCNQAVNDETAAIEDMDTQGEYTLIFTAKDTTEIVLIYNATGNTTAWLEVDNISIRELPGNHATQTVSASRPVYRTDGVLHWLEFDGVDDYFYMQSVTLSNIMYAIAHDTKSDSQGLYLSDANYLNPWLFTYSAGSTSGSLTSGGITLDSLRVDGQEVIVTTRGNAHTAITGNHVQQWQATMTDSTNSWFLFKYFAAGYEVFGSVYGVVLRSEGLNSSEKNKLDVYLATKSGVTL